ncbi:MAG: hypothetical protein IJV41_00275 [Oscillospiraceae bacterium]|nr:hypothetical protein [Oscillospiraceae bacterium]
MKKCKCTCGCKVKKLIFKVLGIALVANAALFAVFFFDLDGKLLFNVVEPFLKKHYDDMDRKDTLKTPYSMDKFPKYDYNS